jgi:NAD(P)-dependent dehydrogenase (short-subunit alcohol dehydrogenase family)
MDLNGISAIVTGGASGLGGATARAMAAAGAKLTIVDVNREAAEAAARELGGIAAVCDVANAEAAEQAFALERFPIILRHSLQRRSSWYTLRV